MLRDLGARVIKIEAPGTGNDTRGWGSPFVRPPGAADNARDESTYLLSANRNKKSVALDLKADDDKAVLLDLVGRADVLVENFRTGGYDQIAQGEAGLMSLTDGLFRCRGGSVQIAVGSEGLWRRFCAGFELDPEASGLATNSQRVANRDRLVELIEDVFSPWSAPDLLSRLSDIGIPAGKVRTIGEVYAWDQARSQGLVIDVEHETLGDISLAGPPLRFFDAAGRESPRVDRSDRWS